MQNHDPVVVVGAGLSGLVCARMLQQAGEHVIVLEREAEVGGRVRTTRHADGYLIDRGFQVVFSAYPALRRHVDLDALDAGSFGAGMHIWTGSRRVQIDHPVRHPGGILRTATSSVMPVADKFRLAGFAAHLLRSSWASAADAASDSPRSGLEMLQQRGFSTAFIDRIARPFWGGITLDRSLSTSDGVLQFTKKMSIQGRAVLPSTGIGGLPSSIAAQLPAGAVRFGQQVTGLVRHGERVTGVQAGDETIDAAAVVLATDPRTTTALTENEDEPPEMIGCTTFYLAGTRDPEVESFLAMDGTGELMVNHIAPLSTVQPSYAPGGKHLIAAVVLDGTDDDEANLDARVTRDVATLLGHAEGDWTIVERVDTPEAQFRQPPGFEQQRPATASGIPGLTIAGDLTVDSSINGAIISGERAAENVLTSLRQRPVTS